MITPQLTHGSLFSYLSTTCPSICSDLIQNSTVYSVQPMWQHATDTNIPVMPMYEHNQTEVNPHWLPGMYWNTLTSPWGLV